MCEKCLSLQKQLRPGARRFADAYLQMAEFYRPMAPSDGCGHIELTRRQLSDKHRLRREALEYAIQTQENDNKGQHPLRGITSYETNKAFCYLKEAAEILFSGTYRATTALRLVELAERELKHAINGAKYREVRFWEWSKLDNDFYPRNRGGSE